MNSVNTKRKTGNNIRIFKDWISTVGELRNLDDIGGQEITMHPANIFRQRVRNPTRITNLIH